MQNSMQGNLAGGWGTCELLVGSSFAIGHWGKNSCIFTTMTQRSKKITTDAA